MSYAEVSDLKEAAAQLIKRGEIVNLTPHPVRVALGWFCWIGDPMEACINPDSPYEQIQTNAQAAAGVEGGPSQWVDIPPAGEPYRLREDDSPGNWTDLSLGAVYPFWQLESPVGVVAGIVTRRFDLGEVPQEREGVTYIVSLPALMGLASAGIYRKDLIAPDTGRTAVRDGHGQILAVRGFVRLEPPSLARKAGAAARSVVAAVTKEVHDG